VTAWPLEVVASFEDGPALWDAIVARELEGVVAKREREPGRPGARLWVKTKNRRRTGSERNSRGAQRRSVAR
jgi:ATP-dependent DNA ligase